MPPSPINRLAVQAFAYLSTRDCGFLVFVFGGKEVLDIFHLLFYLLGFLLFGVDC
jgi:hypothetical protein